MAEPTNDDVAEVEIRVALRDGTAERSIRVSGLRGTLLRNRRTADRVLEAAVKGLMADFGAHRVK